MQYLFMIEAAKYNVFPLDDRRYERFNAATAGRPDLAGDRTTMTFWPGMDTLMENTVLNIKNRSHTVTAEFTVEAGKSDGVLIAQGGRFAGWVDLGTSSTGRRSTATTGSTTTTTTSRPPSRCPSARR